MEMCFNKSFTEVFGAMRSRACKLSDCHLCDNMCVQCCAKCEDTVSAAINRIPAEYTRNTMIRAFYVHTTLMF